MSILKNKARLQARHEDKKKLPPVTAWGHYRKHNRPYQSVTEARERRLLVALKDVSLAYEGKTVISNLSFEIHSGDYICIIGENGSGKTTLMNALLGLKGVSSGSIKLHGLKKKEIGVLPQKTPVQNDFPALVSEIVLSGCVGKKTGLAFYNRKDKRRAFENMEKLGITSIANQSFRELSGGQQQRVLLARALCSAEKMLVLDEPVASLDPKACADTYSLIRDINQQENMTVIMVSHDIKGVLEHATHVLQINKNSIQFFTKEDFAAAHQCPVCAQKPKGETSSYGNSDAYRYKGGESDA